MTNDSARNLGFYVHVPFCASKCPYCDFYSVKFDRDLADRCVAAVCEALRAFAPALRDRSADTVYFGGGTPSVLDPAALAEILRTLRQTVCLDENAEITAEVNPADGSAGYFEALAAAGVNRVSVGVQSARDAELRFLGRRHTAADAANTARQIRAAGIGNLSMDLMVGLPGQDAESLRRSAAFCREAGAKHLSLYLLKIEDGTPFARRKSELGLPDEDESADLYLAACEAAENAGYRQYEISNFAVPGFESRHNLKYWRGEEYLGFGPGAHSCFGGRRFCYPRDLEAFLNAGLPEDDGPAGGFEETVMLRLRLTEGLDLHELSAKYRREAEALSGRARRLAGSGLVRTDGERLRLTRQGFLLSNAVIAKLLYG